MIGIWNLLDCVIMLMKSNKLILEANVGCGLIENLSLKKISLFISMCDLML